MLLAGGALCFAWAPRESWGACAALLTHLAGLLVLYFVGSRWLKRVQAARSRPSSQSRAPHGCAVALLRAGLILALVGWTGFALWSAAIQTNEMFLLLTGGRTVDAQVIGKEIVENKAPVGYVNYSYRVSRTIAPVSRFAVPHAAYPRYRVGQRLTVTYAVAAPGVHRLGQVDWPYALRNLLYLALIYANGAAYFFLPLRLLEYRRRRAREV